jgi:uracil-DNA glycosylase family 4
MTHAARGDGPESAKIMIVGEAWGEQEENTRQPFQGASGQELNKMLHEAGIMRSECYTTNLINARPPWNDLTKWMPAKKKDVTHDMVALRDRMVMPIIRDGYNVLLSEIETVKPNVIVALGNAAMWALTGRWGILKWRGSQLETDFARPTKVIPTIHPAAVLREYSWRPTAINDLKRAARERATPEYTNKPKWNFRIRPSLQVVLDTLAMLTDMAITSDGQHHFEFDLETSPRHITCAGISWSRLDAICIPITYPSTGADYWSLEEEAVVIHALYQFLTNPKVKVRGQNLLYDCQHTYRWWHFVPNVAQDTMISHHSMFSGMKKSLDFQASLYCDYYVYWKEMHKDLSNKAGA